jgi:tetratricopeptide (TPR) repeat protein
MIGDETRATAKAELEYELHFHRGLGIGVGGDRHQEIRTCLHTLGVKPVSLHQLPVEVAHFTGRSVELEKAIAILQQAQYEGKFPTLLAISGAAGVGKSAFAIHVAHCIKHDLSEIQFYANLRGTENQPLEPQEILSSFMQLLGVGYLLASTNLAEQLSIYQRMLSGRRVLIVLDNARDAAQVQPLLPDSPTCAVIVTSRQPLELPGTPLELKPLPPAEALELLQKVGHVPPLPAANQLAMLCGCLPLALKITGGTLRSQAQSLEHYADQLADKRQKLEQLKSSYLDVRASFAVSYVQQEKAIARLLRLTGLLVRPNLTAAIVAALLDCDLEAANKILSALVRSGLVEPAEAGYFQPHNLIRLFAKEQLARGESAEMRRIVRLRASYWYCETAGLLALAFDWTGRSLSLAPLEQPLNRSDDELLRAVLNWFDQEKLNLLAALEWANQTRAWETVVSLAQNLTRWFDLRHDWKNWEQTHRLALEASHKLSDRHAEAQILNSLGNAYFRQDHRKKAREHYEKSLSLLRELGDRYQESQTLTNLGILYKQEGDDEKAIALWQTALKGFPANSAAARQLEFWLQLSQGVDLDAMQPNTEEGDRPPRFAIQQIIAGFAIGAIALLVVMVLLIRRI